MRSKILVIVGPTASGKSALAENLAKRYRGEVLCVDSRTVYRGMDIGTAKSDGWGIDLVDPNEEYSIAEFKTYAEKTIKEILSRGHLPILVGGTGLWIDAIVDNLDLPAVPPNPLLRAELEACSLSELQQKLLGLDPQAGQIVDLKNKRRVIRAFEVLITSGRTLQVLRQRGEQKYDVVKMGIDVPKEELDQRIDARVDKMMAQGFLAEVQRLKQAYGCDVPAMTGIGYRQLCGLSTEQRSAVQDIKRNTCLCQATEAVVQTRSAHYLDRRLFSIRDATAGSAFPSVAFISTPMKKASNFVSPVW